MNKVANRFLWWCVLLPICVGALFPLNAKATTLLELRTATHPGYTRIVAQLDEAAVYELRSSSEREWVLELYATQPGARVKPPRFKRSSHIAGVTFETDQGRTRLQISTRGILQPATFTLTGPYRVVIDFKPAPTSAPAPSVKSGPRTEATEPNPAILAGATTSTVQEVPASDPPESPAVQGSVEETEPSPEVGSELVSEISALQTSPESEPNEWVPPDPPTLELGSPSPTNADGVSGALLYWLLNLLLFVCVVFLWLQNRRLRAELGNRRTRERTESPEQSELLVFEDSHTDKPRPRHSSRRRSSLRNWRIRHWMSFHYRDLIFFFVLLLIVVLVALSL